MADTARRDALARGHAASRPGRPSHATPPARRSAPARPPPGAPWRARPAPPRAAWPRRAHTARPPRAPSASRAARAAARPRGTPQATVASTASAVRRGEQAMVELHGGDVLGQVARRTGAARRSRRAPAARPSAETCCRSRPGLQAGHEAAGQDGQPTSTQHASSARRSAGGAAAAAADAAPSVRSTGSRRTAAAPAPDGSPADTGDTAVASGKKPEATMNQPTAPCSPPSTNSSTQARPQPALDRAAPPQPDQRHQEGHADQPAPQPVHVFQPEDLLEAGEAEASFSSAYCGICRYSAIQPLPFGLR